MRARVAQEDREGGREADDAKARRAKGRRDREKKGGLRGAKGRSGFLRESRTAGRRIKISVNKRWRWS